VIRGTKRYRAALAVALALVGLTGAPGLAAAAVASPCQTGGSCVAVQRAKLSFPLLPGRGGTFTPLPGPPNAVEQDEGVVPTQPTVGPLPSVGAETSFAGPLLGNPAGPAAESPFASFAGVTPRSFLDTELGVPPNLNSPQEPTTAVSGKVAWYTGNDSDALSTTGGSSFTYVNPATMFPAKGLSFCCDQVVTYSPQAKLFVWVLQYWCSPGTSSPATTYCPTPGTGSNRVRIAVASPTGLIKNAKHPGRAWTYWSVTPGSFNPSIGGPGTWLDQSKLTVNKRFVEWSIDVLRGSQGIGSVMLRIPLAQLAARGRMHFRFLVDSHAKLNVPQGSTATTWSYFIGNDGTNQTRVWSWAASKNFGVLHLIGHTGIPTYNAAIVGSDGVNSYSRWGTFPGSVESATLAGHTLWVAQGTGRAYCTANCSPPGTPTLNPLFKEPAIYISKYDVRTWTLVGEQWVWNNNWALGWPALATDGAGDVGLAMRASGYNGAALNPNPQPAVMFLSPSSAFYTAESGPGLDFVTGDYYSLRPGRSAETFVMTAQFVQAFPKAMTWQYIEWGRGSGP
jgi:hypothetical protein